MTFRSLILASENGACRPTGTACWSCSGAWSSRTASAVATDVRLERGGDGLVVRETRIWGSILVPIYLQLLEALRRVSEGSRATWCRECGQLFLTLDARRSTFCTDRERIRFAQRARARAIAASGGAP